MSREHFKARLFFIDDTVQDINVWCDGFVPMEHNQRPANEWVYEHLECSIAANLRELLGVPPEGNYQVVFEGVIFGWEDWQGEYDEDIEIPDPDTISMAPVPASYLADDDLFNLLMGEQHVDTGTTDDPEDAS